MNLLDSIKEDIHNWNLIRNTPIALNFLTSGCGFTIDYQDYLEWKAKNPSNIHCYFSLDELQLRFHLVDDVSDLAKNYTIGQNLVQKDFTRSTGPNGLDNSNGGFKPFKFSPIKSIDPQEAMERIIEWILSAEMWFENQIQNINETKGILRIITIPFSDLESLFAESQASVFAFFAMKEFTIGDGTAFNIELILSQMNPENTSSANVNASAEPKGKFEDVTRPCPPFGGDMSQFGLLD